MQLLRPLLRLRDYGRLCVDLLAFLKVYWFDPGDSPTVEMGSELQQLRVATDTVTLWMTELKPLRPGVSPWKNSGLASYLRPDFKARGILVNSPDPQVLTQDSDHE